MQAKHLEIAFVTKPLVLKKKVVIRTSKYALLYVRNSNPIEIYASILLSRRNKRNQDVKNKNSITISIQMQLSHPITN